MRYLNGIWAEGGGVKKREANAESKQDLKRSGINNSKERTKKRKQ